MREFLSRLVVGIFREFWSHLRLNAEANARCLDTARRLSDIRAQIHCGRYTISGNASVETETVANLRSPHTGSQQVGTIDTNTTIPIIEVDFAEPGMCVPIHQVSRRA